MLLVDGTFLRPVCLSQCCSRSTTWWAETSRCKW